MVGRAGKWLILMAVGGGCKAARSRGRSREVVGVIAAR